MKIGTPQDKARAFELRQQGMSYAKIGRELGFSAPTVSGWLKAAELPPLPEIDPDSASVGHQVDSVTVTEPDGGPIVHAPQQVDADLAALKDELRKRDAEIIRLAAERDRYKPTVDVSHLFFDTEADLDRFYSDDQYRDMVQLRIDEVNQENAKRNRPAVRITDTDAYETILRDIKRELLTGGLGSVHDGPWTRKIKFAKPNATDSDGNKVFDMSQPIEIVGLPLEPQVNNTAGSLADGVVIYTQKGYKLTEPFICPAGPCFRKSALTPSGNWAHEGYCSQEHHDRIENALRTRIDDNRSMVGIAVGAVR